jgi:hypothetical protein
LAELVSNPRESLSVELKGWIDPRTVEGSAKIVKTCIALRNANGGYLLIGFDDDTGQPQMEPPFGPIEQLFKQDEIQSLVAKYSSEAFEIAVHLFTVDMQQFPVIKVPPGVLSPVCARADMKNAEGLRLIEANAVYVRSLSSNNRASTCKATWKDYARLVDYCFENREADIGRFVRRHLAGISSDLVNSIITPIIRDHAGEDLHEKIYSFLDFGDKGFATIAKERNLAIVEHGAWETALFVKGETQEVFTTDTKFIALLSTNNPQYTGWPAWIDSRGFADQEARPYVFNNGWEALIVTTDRSLFEHIDFQRLEPKGRFYMRRAYEDDIRRSARAPAPFTVLDLPLRIYRVAETIAVGSAFAKGMQYPEDQSELHFAFRWTRLRNRELASWADPGRHIWPGHRAYQDAVCAYVTMPLEVAPASYFEFVHEAVFPLANVFAGFELDKKVTEDITKRLLERRM